MNDKSSTIDDEIDFSSQLICPLGKVFVHYLAYSAKSYELSYFVDQKFLVDNKELTENYRLAEDKEIFRAKNISRADVAHFLLRTAKETTRDRRAMTLTR